MREFFKNAAGEFLDISYYGILRREWETINTDRKTQPIKDGMDIVFYA